MTSRFGKTYNRKGGEANSKFEEVFSNKKATLTTKWGETTYKAKLGTKRPQLKSDVAEFPKRPRLEESDSDDDPFGFDSEDESKSDNEGSATNTAAVKSSVTGTVVTSAQSTASSTSTVTSKCTPPFISESYYFHFLLRCTGWMPWCDVELYFLLTLRNISLHSQANKYWRRKLFKIVSPGSKVHQITNRKQCAWPQCQV